MKRLKFTVNLIAIPGKIVRLKTKELYEYIDSRLSWESPVFISEKLLMSFLGGYKIFLC